MSSSGTLFEERKLSEPKAETVRVKIYRSPTDNDDDRKKCKEILEHPLSCIEEDTKTYMVAEITLVDFEVLRNNRILIEWISKIPSKEKLSFEVPPDGGHFELVIPHMPLDADDRMKSLGFKLLERSRSGWLVYLTADQVRGAYNLPFVHSIIPRPAEYNRKGILELFQRESAATVSCHFTNPPLTEQAMTDFAESWRSKTKLDVSYSTFGFFSIKLSQPADITHIDELAKMQGIVSISGSGRVTTC